MNREQIFTLVMGLAGVGLFVMACYAIFRVVTSVYLLKYADSEEDVREALSVIYKVRRMTAPFFFAFSGSVIIALVFFTERLVQLLWDHFWLVPVACAVHVVGLFNEVVLIRKVRRRIERRRSECWVKHEGEGVDG